MKVVLFSAVMFWFAHSFASLSAAELTEIFEPRVYQNGAQKKLNYRLLKPLVYDQSRKYPLVVFLHGGGERGDDNVAQLMHGVGEFATDDNRRNFPCFVVAPQCPKGTSWVNRRHIGDDPNADPTEPTQLLIELLDQLQEEFSIDSNRLYVTGLSLGGHGTWGLIQRFPNVFAAAAPLCGEANEEQAGRLTKIPIWVFHGAADTGNDPEMSRRMVAALRRAGGKPLYTEYPGVEHNCWTITYRNPLFMTWLFAQSLDR